MKRRTIDTEAQFSSFAVKVRWEELSVRDGWSWVLKDNVIQRQFTGPANDRVPSYSLSNVATWFSEPEDGLIAHLAELDEACEARHDRRNFCVRLSYMTFWTPMPHDAILPPAQMIAVGVHTLPKAFS